jgi:hypothetical protein
MARIGIWLLKSVFILVTLCVLIYIVLVISLRPSNDRDWSPDQELLAQAEIVGNTVSIKNIRNINYRSTSDYDVRYYDKIFDLNNIESVWYMVEPFSGYGAGAAHTLISFGFGGGDYVAISVEIRKEKGESFSPIGGLLRQYELMYVIADEQDVIKLRSNYRNDDVFLYPIEISREHMQQLFVSMLNRANKLAVDPEFYNTLTNTCTTNIVTHVDEIVPGKVPFSYKILMPAYSDELAYDAGLLGTSFPMDKLREKYHINERARKFADDPLFSQRIRE